MFGQPQIKTWLKFDITGFQIVEEEIEEVGAVVEILDTSEPFTLRLEFEGSGTDWEKNVCGITKPHYKVHFDAEGMGPWSHLEMHLGEATGKLEANKFRYRVDYKVPNGIPRDGVYRLSAMVTFYSEEDGVETGYTGVLGFAEGLVIQVHHLEE
jgi:hypothetical protein